MPKASEPLYHGMWPRFPALPWDRIFTGVAAIAGWEIARFMFYHLTITIH